MGPKDHGVEQRAPVEFLRRMLATIEAGTVELPAFPQVVIQVQEVLRKNWNYSAQMIARPVSVRIRLSPTSCSIWPAPDLHPTQRAG